jgi:hypothetical protein
MNTVTAAPFLESTARLVQPNHVGDNSKETNWCCGKASTRRLRKHN